MKSWSSVFWMKSQVTALNAVDYQMTMVNSITYTDFAIPDKALLKYRYVDAARAGVNEDTNADVNIRYRLLHVGRTHTGHRHIEQLGRQTCRHGFRHYIRHRVEHRTPASPSRISWSRRAAAQTLTDSAGRFRCLALRGGTHNFARVCPGWDVPNFSTGCNCC